VTLGSVQTSINLIDRNIVIYRFLILILQTRLMNTTFKIAFTISNYTDTSNVDENKKCIAM